jgi:cellulose synthase/poly-beta-1,6-N-acetylglucosamine synthase-like glycosyltransferase
MPRHAGALGFENVIAELLTFFALLSLLITALVVLVSGVVRTRAWLGVPLGALAAAAAAAALRWLTGDVSAAEFLFAWAVVMGIGARLLFERWSYLASLLFASILLSGVTYLVYSVLAAVVDPLGPIVWFGTVVLLLLELVALGLSLSYAFEVLDVLSRRERPRHPLAPYYRPLVAIQVPTYNEPVEVVSRTLESLALLDYPNYCVQVVDNNTKDPLVWRPLEALCENLGPRFQFMHLDNWPGYKAGALNEATRRLPPEVEVVGIVDADYVVEPGFLRATVGHFADPRVAFVQTPQNYRDWEDDSYLRGLFYSYRYFFDITMPARANRNAIIFAGTMGLMRRSALEGIGGWSTQTVTEDAEASLRMLGQGFTGVYVPEAYGSGLMPLSFDGLKKQRFRWALGGIQILRMHWRELLPFAPHRLRLTTGQRIHYLLGSVQWFGDVLTVAFTVLLLLTATVTVVHHRLPVREIVGPLSLVPVLFLVTGVGRALWAIRVTARCTLGDAVRCLRCWFALSWVVTLACLRGAVRREAAFLRTPKRAERRSVWQAIRASRAESLIAALAAVAGVAIIVSAFSVGTVALAVLLLWLALQFSSAPWASFAAEGIRLTPLRAAYRRSSQSTGDWPERSVPMALRLAVPVAGVVALGVGALLLLTPSAPNRTPATPDLPQTQQLIPPVAVSTPKPTPTPTPTATPARTPTPTPTQQPTATPTPRATPTATPTTAPTPTPHAT